MSGRGGGSRCRRAREPDAKKKRALHSRFNRKTSFIRSFIIIKEPGETPRFRPPRIVCLSVDGDGGERGREKNRQREGDGDKALRYYFGSLIIFSSALLDICQCVAVRVGGRGGEGFLKKGFFGRCIHSTAHLSTSFALAFTKKKKIK